jgi:hypothetical protein
MKLHSSIENRVDLFQKYYRFANERPLFGFFIGSEYPLHRYNAPQNLPEDRPLSPDDFEVALYLDDCDRLFDEHEACGGDFIFSASAFWGIPWLEAIVGCDVIADHQSGSIHSEKPSSFKGPDDIPSFDPRLPWAMKAVEFIKAMAQRSNGRWPIGTTRMRGISDLLSALYGGQEYLFAMMEKPGEVRAVCEELTDIWIEFGKLQLEHIPLYHDGIGSFYYNMWAPAGTIWHQEDAAALLNPDIYDEFIRPYDEQILKAFDGCIMHQHPTGFVPTNYYLKMPFTALELHIDQGGASAEELYETHIKILEKKPLLIWGDIPEKDIDWIFDKLPVEGLAVMTVIDSPERAALIWQKYIG